MTNRRDAILFLAAACTFPAVVRAQKRMPVVGILSGLPREKSLITPILLKEMAAQGYVEGKNMRLEFRSVDENVERYPAMARQLVDARCSVIFALANLAAAQALAQINTKVPVVLLASEYDPVETGIVHSLARPGGNMTGVFIPAALLMAKNLEIAGEVLPEARRMLVLSDKISQPQLPDLRRAAASRGFSLTVVEYERQPYDLARAFEAGRQAKVHAALVPLSPTFAMLRQELSRLIVSHSLPAFVPPFMINDPGSLLSYGVDFARVSSRAAAVADRILKGADPAGIAIEQVSDFRLTINMRTAKALGLKLPYSVLARATALIE